MRPGIITGVVLTVATFPLIYYVIALYSSWRFFHQRSQPKSADPPFTPPVSNLKPIRGLDPEAYENFASLCRQDYPEYELLFCVGSYDDPAVPLLERLKQEFPERAIRIVIGSHRTGANDKVAKLARLTEEARYEVLVINDSDVRVESNYFRNVVAPLSNPEIGAVTCLYSHAETKTFADKIHAIGMISDFFPSTILARQLDGVKFALGTTIVTTRTQLAKFGGYDSIINRPADDLLIGRLISEQGKKVELLPYRVLTVSDYSSFYELLHKRLRWIVVLRHMRPAGHFGLLFTFGLPWCCLAIALFPSWITASVFGGSYLALRILAIWLIGGVGLGQKNLWLKMPLVLVWDALAFFLWLVSFTRQSIRWRDGKYRIDGGQLVPVPAKD